MTRTERYLKAALAYARAGLRVFPLEAGEKTPAIPSDKGGRGFHDATTDELQIGRWWTVEYPGANIGIRTGSGLLVIDIDIRDAKRGDAEYDGLQTKLGALPDTRETETWSHGKHKWFRVPADAKFPKTATRPALESAIDLKGEGGYVVAPPSIHKGEFYKWAGELGFSEPIAELPMKWLEYFQEESRKEEKPAAAPKEKISTGSRNDFLFNKVCRGCGEGMSLELLQRYAEELNQEWCEPPLPAREVQYLVRKAHERYSANPTPTFTAAPESAADQAAEPATRPPAQDVSEQPWFQLLQKTHRKTFHGNLRNVSLVLENHPAWNGFVKFDEFRERVTILDGGPESCVGEVDEKMVLNITNWFQINLTPHVKGDVILQALQMSANAHRFHPIRDYLTSLEWDMESRLTRGFLPRYFGAGTLTRGAFGEDQELYWDHVAVCFFVSAVARVFLPGCQVDHCMVLEGNQGEYKSTSLRILAGAQYFTDQIPTLESRDASDQLRGYWIIEFPELARLLKSDLATIKAFLTRRKDVYRAAWGRDKIAVERQCVFTGSTNEMGYLLDDSGGRRFWPVFCRKIDLKALEQDRDQIWAEAFHLFSRGVPWWPKEAYIQQVMKTEQTARYTADPWTDAVITYASAHASVRTSDVLQNLKVPYHQQTRQHVQRISAILSAQGWSASKNDEGLPVFHRPGEVRPYQGALQ